MFSFASETKQMFAKVYIKFKASYAVRKCCCNYYKTVFRGKVAFGGKNYI